MKTPNNQIQSPRESAQKSFYLTTHALVTPLGQVEAEKRELKNQITLLADTLRTNERADKWLEQTRTVTELRAYKSALHAAYYAIGDLTYEGKNGLTGGISLLNI